LEDHPVRERFIRPPRRTPYRDLPTVGCTPAPQKWFSLLRIYSIVQTNGTLPLIFDGQGWARNWFGCLELLSPTVREHSAISHPYLQVAVATCNWPHSPYLQRSSMPPRQHVDDTILPPMGEPWCRTQLRSRPLTPPPNYVLSVISLKQLRIYLVVHRDTNRDEVALLPWCGFCCPCLELLCPVCVYLFHLRICPCRTYMWHDGL